MKRLRTRERPLFNSRNTEEKERNVRYSHWRLKSKKGEDGDAGRGPITREKSCQGERNPLPNSVPERLGRRGGKGP